MTSLDAGMCTWKVLPRVLDRFCCGEAAAAAAPPAPPLVAGGDATAAAPCTGAGTTRGPPLFPATTLATENTAVKASTEVSGGTAPLATVRSCPDGAEQDDSCDHGAHGDHAGHGGHCAVTGLTWRSRRVTAIRKGPSDRGGAWRRVHTAQRSQERAAEREEPAAAGRRRPHHTTIPSKA
jgi:hypothetical protein